MLSLSTSLTFLFTGLSHCRDPNGADLPVWPQYSVQSREYLEFGGPYNFTVRDNHRADDYCDVWRSINEELRSTT